MVGLHQAEDRRAGLDVVAGPQRQVGDDAVGGRVDLRALQIQRRLVPRRLGGEIARMLFRRRIGLAAQLGQNGGQLLLQRRQLLPRRGQVVARLVELGLRGDLALRHLLVDAELLLVEGDVLLRHHDLGLLLAIAGLLGQDAVAGGPELRLGLGERQAEGLRVDLEEQLPGRDMVIVGDGDGLHLAGDLGADGGDVGLHIGVVGRHIARARDVEVSAADQQRERPEDQQQRPQPAHQGTARRRAHRRRGFGNGRGGHVRLLRYRVHDCT